jgi:lipopolysaccharide export system protein LptC
MRVLPLLPILLLALIAAATGWLLWQLRDQAPPTELLGPPRSDYSLDDFELVALDADGREAFFATGPRLARHPQLGTIDIEQPRFAFPDRDGAVWTSRAERAWLNREGSELRLHDAVELLGPPDDDAPMRLTTERLDVFPRDNRVATEAAVTITEPGSILRARGLRAELDTRRVELLSEVKIRHEPPRRR